MLLDPVGHRVHEVRFAEPDAAIDEQRVISLPRIAGHLDRGCLGELVALPFDETVKCEAGVDGSAEDAKGPDGELCPALAAHGRH